MEGEIRMPEKTIIIEWMERMKEVQRIQYDYFKYLISLSTGSILIIIAILEKVFTSPQTLVVALIMISMVGFAVTIIFSLCALPNLGNIILYINGLQKAVMINDKKEAKDNQEKIEAALDKLKTHDRGVFWSYVSGIVILLISVGLYFFN